MIIALAAISLGLAAMPGLLRPLGRSNIVLLPHPNYELK